jgi:NAD(P)-dependent dehydrogenase (short-subunit alcohol dehydrogenase family)
MCKYFVPLVLKSELKTIVNISSVGAHLSAHGMSAYQSSKTAVLRLNDFLTVEYGEQGLITFGIQPGVSFAKPTIHLVSLAKELTCVQSVLTELASNIAKELHSRLIDKPELAGDSLVWLTKERREW